MVVKFNRKPIQIPYQKMIRYKIFQFITICKIFKSLKLIKLQIIFYILDNNLDIGVLEENLKNEEFLITTFNPDILKTIDYCFGFHFILFSLNNFKLTKEGDEFYKEILEEKIFVEEIKKIKLLYKKNTYLNQYIKRLK